MADTMQKYGDGELKHGEDDRERPNERFTFGEVVVLLTIFGLSLLSGMTSAIFIMQLLNLGFHMFVGKFEAIGPFFGVVLIAFLSEFNGRKRVIILLAALSTSLSIILAIPSSAAWLSIGFLIHAIEQGGTQTMSFLIVAEYSNPKHRLSYLIGTEAFTFMGFMTGHAFCNYEVLAPGLVYVQVCMAALGLACAASACAWPESPYWLAARTRGAEAARALRRLRGAGAARELAQLRRERRVPVPPHLYWKPLLLANVAISVFCINLLHNYIASYYFVPDRIIEDGELSNIVDVCVSIVLLLIIAFISYFVKRKVLYLACCVIPLAFHYALGIWLWVDDPTSLKVFQGFVLICNILQHSAIRISSLALFIEIIPYKYNTHISCVCMMHLYLAYIFQMLFLPQWDLRDHVFVAVLLITTLSMPGMALFYWLAPETQGKTLFEIQASYTTKQGATCPEQNETIMEDIPAQLNQQ